MIKRDLAQELQLALTEYPAVTLLGPRQSGKTTLARMQVPQKPWVSLEDPDVRLAAEADPRGFLAQYPAGAIFDEVQRFPALLSYLQGAVDRNPEKGRFVLTGSHQPALHQAISQSLAGRTAVLQLWPFSLHEVGQYGALPPVFDLMLRGFYPRVHEEKLDPARFFSGYLQTYVERDVRSMLQVQNLSLFQKFLSLLAGRVGQIVNFASLSNDVGVSTAALRNWLSVLKASSLVFELSPFFENVHKRVIKSSKIYFTDVGLAAYLLGIRDPEQLARDPLRGQLYENMVIADIYKGILNRGERVDLYFYRDTHGNEVDLLLRNRGELVPIEIKSSSTFTPEFLKGIERFRALGVGKTHPGFVLFNGDQEFEVRGVKAFNPLSGQVPDIMNRVSQINS
jgi:uncharacterized protein